MKTYETRRVGSIDLPTCCLMTGHADDCPHKGEPSPDFFRVQALKEAYAFANKMPDGVSLEEFADFIPRKTR